MTEFCFASNNLKKLSEVRQMVVPDFRILSLQDINCTDELPETQNTFRGNSLQKAEYIYKKFNIPCFADDSGLEVTALDGAPGVYSARYAGEGKNDQDNIDLLLRNMKNAKDRTAQFRAVITFVSSEGTFVFEGIIKGKITEQREGSSGFGYDPVFTPEGYSQTFAQMSAEQKNSISHRAIAVKELVKFLKENFA